MNISDSTKTKLLQDTISEKITDEEFLGNFEPELLENPEIIIRDAYERKSVIDLELGIALIWALKSDVLPRINGRLWCKLLSETWHFSHEDIAFILQKSPDPTTVDCLYTSALARFEYLDYDDFFGLARKSIKALAAIGNEEAISKLRLLAENENTTIRDYALREL
jgi:hypothetical protein